MKLEIEFVKCNTADNMTILVVSELPPVQLAPIASQLMSYGHLYAEQVGYVEGSAHHGCAAKLQMAGGEFCGNACLALGAQLASARMLLPGERVEVMLETSGSLRPVTCQVEKLSSGYQCEASTPIPKTVERSSFAFEGLHLEVGIVRYADSFHLLIDLEQFELDAPTAERLARLAGIVTGADLVGVMLYRPSTHELKPLIFVPALDSLVWEQGCGSGTASLGCYLAWSTCKSIDIPVLQPGGIIHTSVCWHEKSIKSVHIKSTVDIVAQGKTYVNIAN